ncbi:hypothetical protein [Aestuariivivens insulae]|uniref:hypothetical protein n=1 Tax=Aestuariivivens insulae TaxID=1621988 RepID=UPI001F5A1889|nr:hypothetical protein [Aestuariivivens insulae]
MRYLSVVVLIVALLSCKTKEHINKKKTNEVTVNWCPDNGRCSFEVFSNKELLIKYDEFNELYSSIVDGKNIVLKIEYVRNEMPNTVDGGLREQVFLEVNPKTIKEEAKDSKSIKIIYARWCYCKGQAGYFRPSNKEVYFKKVNNERYELNLDFKMKEIPQSISHIVQVFNLP